MAWLGMNLEIVNGELPKWESLAEEIDTIITNVNTQVVEAKEAWNGADSDKFVSDWEGTHRPQLMSVKNLITSLSTQLQGEIAEQRAKSSQ